MVSTKINQVLAALRTAGIQVTRGYPGSKIAGVVKPVAAVSLEEYTDRFLTLAVDVFGPTEWDGSACEELALNIAAILQEDMAACTVGKCQFAGKMGLFTVRVLAKWYRELEYAVDIDENRIARVTSFCAEKSTVRVPYIDSTTGDVLTKVEQNEWTIKVTDIWPLNEKLPEERTDAFTLFVMRPGGLEAYEECTWQQITIEETPAGVLRTRVAKTYQDRVVGGG